ncbi:MAG: 2-isopropylmalate synthase, partial [Candidatus Diapherotrites archaeon]|nr:2-isopropylmalate synthase [Candidatus Diapherotrites archaeon]
MLATINGLGERAGNTPLEEIVVALHDFLDVHTGINEKKLIEASSLVERISGISVSDNKPIIGSNVFVHTAGIHADGDSKGNLYRNKLLPERFGREREYALGKLSGRASVEMNLKKLGIELSKEQ